jgi:hypothetical protein
MIVRRFGVFAEESCFCAKVKAVEHQDRQPPSGFRLQDLGSRRISVRAFPRAKSKSWSRSSAKKSFTLFNEML